ncbi:MAG: hypothetical protein ACTMKY_00855 [Dermabacteraceae bacterium]|uniref:hypothetical protein n=1 Tax=Brachybacterium TaxID=43668 RepID=UPI003F90AE5E
MNTTIGQRVWDDVPVANFSATDEPVQGLLTDDQLSDSTDAEVARVLSSRVAPTDAPDIFHAEDLNEFDNEAVADNESVGNTTLAAVDLSGRFLFDRVAVPTDSTPETITPARIDHSYDTDSDVWQVTLHGTDGREFTFDPEVTVIALAPGAEVQSATRYYDKSSVARIGA